MTLASNTYTAAVGFQTPGDLSVAYATQQGDYFRDTATGLTILRFNLLFTPTFTTAGGALKINGSGLSPVLGATPFYLGSATFSGAHTSGYVASIRPSGDVHVIDNSDGLVIDTTDFVSGTQYSLSGEIVAVT